METDYTKFEIARLIGARALQIKMGSPIFISKKDKNFKQLKKSNNLIRPIDIAKLEFNNGVLPMTVKRKNEVFEESDYDRLNDITNNQDQISEEEVLKPHGGIQEDNVKRQSLVSERGDIDLGDEMRKSQISVTSSKKIPIDTEDNNISEKIKYSEKIKWPYTELDLDEEKIYLVIPKQKISIREDTTTISSELDYNVELNGKKSVIKAEVSKYDNYLIVEENRIDIEDPLKNFSIQYPDDLGGASYSYEHRDINCYVFKAIGNIQGKMYYLYDKEGEINPITKGNVWILLHEDCKLKTETTIIEEFNRWLWEEYQPMLINLKETDIVIENSEDIKKLYTTEEFSIEGEKIVDDFKGDNPLFTGTDLIINAPKEIISGLHIHIKNKSEKNSGNWIRNWISNEPFNLKVPDELPSECGEFQIDIYTQNRKRPISCIHFRYIPSITLEYQKNLIVPDPDNGHQHELINLNLKNANEWEIKRLKDTFKKEPTKDGYNIEVPPDNDTVSFTLVKKNKPETETQLQLTIPRLHWALKKEQSRDIEWVDKPQKINKSELKHGETLLLVIQTNDIFNKYDFVAQLETSEGIDQESEFNKKENEYELVLNNFYDTIHNQKDDCVFRCFEKKENKLFKLIDFPLEAKISAFNLDLNHIERAGILRCEFELTCYEDSIVNIMWLDDQDKTLLNEDVKIKQKHIQKEMPYEYLIPTNIKDGKQHIEISINAKKIFEHSFVLENGYNILGQGTEFDINPFLERFNGLKDEIEKLKYVEQIIETDNANFLKIIKGLIGKRNEPEYNQLLELLSKNFFIVIPDLNWREKGVILILLNLHYWESTPKINTSISFNGLSSNDQILLSRFLGRDLIDDIPDKRISEVLHVSSGDKSQPLKTIFHEKELKYWKRHKEELVKACIESFLKTEKENSKVSNTPERSIRLLQYCYDHYENILRRYNEIIS